MSNARLIKGRIKTTKNIRQITKAMEMVAASKMRRAQVQAISSKPYANKLRESMRRVAEARGGIDHALLKKNTVGKKLFLLVSSDKGLTGGMLSNLFRAVDTKLKTIRKEDAQFIIVGKKAKSYILKTDYEVLAEFSELPETISLEDCLPISHMIIEGYKESKFRSVEVIYMNFISTLLQEPTINSLLPIDISDLDMPVERQQSTDLTTVNQHEYLFEPSAEEILEWILPYYVEIYIYQTLVEAKASEHSARMVAMKNASDNAAEIIDGLTLEYNKARQASITGELLDIITSASLA